MGKIVTTEQDVHGPLSEQEEGVLREIEHLYQQVLAYSGSSQHAVRGKNELITLYNKIGNRLQEVVCDYPHLHVYSFSQPAENHGTVSRLVEKLRNVNTSNVEFTYYTQRAFEMLFTFGFEENIRQQKNYFIVPTPVCEPVQNYAIHKLPNLDHQIHNTVMCVMLRGALLPSIIMAKEIQEYSSIRYVPDFALFRIQRIESDSAIEYVLDEDASYWDMESLDGKDLIFADPMNATAGSLLAVLRYLEHHNIRPRSVKLFHIISSLRGALRMIHHSNTIDLYTLWLDPALNARSYIMPGLGDAGDRINGIDTPSRFRNVLQLIANYGQNFLQLYRDQIHKIEERLFGKIQ